MIVGTEDQGGLVDLPEVTQFRTQVHFLAYSFYYFMGLHCALKSNHQS